MKHPHAEVLMAIAENAEAINEFEIKETHHDWDKLVNWGGWVAEPNYYQIRRKPKTIKVNGFDVPEPYLVMPKKGTRYYMPAIGEYSLFVELLIDNDSYDHLVFEREIMHKTVKAAIAHAKAMLGIDPNKEE